MKDNLYYYRAHIIRVVDGDTVILDLDLGFYQGRLAQRRHDGRPPTEPKYRLSRINAPEMRDKGGVEARDALRDLLAAAKELIVRTDKSDSFGRYLIEIWADDEHVNDWLVEQGYAVYKNY